jgi:peptidoglycan/xylan/chitin deacetylase (PgdA/CDA1 family)
MAPRLLAAGALVAIAALSTIVILGGDEPGDAPAPNAAKRDPGSESEPPADWGKHRGPVPVLMYHPIQPPLPDAAYPELFVEPEDFRAQVGWLADHDYEAVTLSQVENGWDGDGLLPPKPVVISFDDGYLSQYVNALPVLRRRDWVGVLDLKATGADLPDDKVREMLKDGWELASHTISHLDLTELDPVALRSEVSGSRRMLERRFDVPVRNFCYPAGRYDDEVVAAVRAAGYRGATTTDPGLADRSEPLTMERIRVEHGDSLDGFVDKLTSAGGA